jgi:copper chaperone CopZ
MRTIAAIASAATATFCALAVLTACGDGRSPAPAGAAQESVEKVALGAPIDMHLVVKGMHCEGCEGAICGKVEKIEGVQSVKASHATESVEVVAPPEQRAAIEAAIKRLGYTVEG